MDRKEAIKLFRRDIECLSHDKCSDCILEKACDPMKTPPDSEYIAAYGMAIEALSAEPCEDAISRQAALDVIAETDITNGTEPVFTGKQVQALLRDLPLVTPKQKVGHWIPVSERLPELGEKVLCQCRAGIYEVLKLTVNGWYFDIDHCYMESFVIAWMPLPEPYIVESEETE